MIIKFIVLTFDKIFIFSKFTNVIKIIIDLYKYLIFMKYNFKSLTVLKEHSLLFLSTTQNCHSIQLIIWFQQTKPEKL